MIIVIIENKSFNKIPHKNQITMNFEREIDKCGVTCARLTFFAK